MSDKIELPSTRTLSDAVIKTLNENDSLTSREIDNNVSLILKITELQKAVPHSSGSGSRTEFHYRMAWVRTKLKNSNLINRNQDNTWSLVK